MRRQENRSNSISKTDRTHSDRTESFIESDNVIIPRVEIQINSSVF